MKLDDTITNMLKEIERLKEPKGDTQVDILNTIVVPAQEVITVTDELVQPVELDIIAICGTAICGFCTV